MFQRFVAVIAVLALAGCATPKGAAKPGPSGTVATVPSGPVKPVVTDPPLAFDRDGVALGEPAEGHFVVYGETVYFLRDTLDIPSLVATDLSAGKPRWSKPVVTDALPGRWGPLRLAVVDSKPRVMLSYLARLKGVGTQADRELLRVIALDGVDGTRLWTVDIDDDKMPTGPTTRFSAFAPPKLIGSSNEHLVIGDSDAVIVLDVRTGNQLWAATGFRPGALESGTVVGLAAGKPTGRAALDGKQVWSSTDVADKVEPLGAGLVTVTASAATKVLEAKSGTVKATVAGGQTCAHDTENLVVCWNGSSHLMAVDMTTAKTLWELPDGSADRIIPRVTAVRRGMIYGVAGPNGPVIVDARTGKDRVTSVAIAPSLVLAGFAMVLSDRGGLYAHRATTGA